MTGSQIFYGIVVLITYAGIAIGSIPRLRMNTITITLVGAAILIATRAISEEQAFAAIDLGTLTLLFSMMVINANLNLAGFFTLVSERVLRMARSPKILLALIVVTSGVIAAVALNDTVCILFTPLVVEVTRRSKRNPVPYLLGLATSANIGSTATITGNPQNLLIGQSSGIPYLTFLLRLAPVALAGLIVCWLVIVLVYRKEFTGKLEVFDLPEPLVYWPLLWRSLGVAGLLIIAFLVGLPIASSAFVAAAALLITRIKPDKLLQVDWGLLVFFGGLFIVTGAIESSGLSEKFFEVVRPVISQGVAPLSIATAGLSNLISNVPAVLLFRPIIPTLPDPQSAWLALAMSSTLAGNLTLLGSVANLIVAQIAEQRGFRITFLAYLRVGLPITVITLTIGMLWLSVSR